MSARTEPLNLTARELVMLGHCLNFVPSNACLTGDGWGGFALVYETKEYAPQGCARTQATRRGALPQARGWPDERRRDDVTALAEALVAAQRRAIGALEKAYVAGAFEDDRMREQLDAMGCTDAVDHDHLIHALDVLRAYGGPLPANGEPATRKPEPATDAQLVLVAKLLNEKGVPPENNPSQPLTKQQAHEVIDTLKAGTYDASKWTVPF